MNIPNKFEFQPLPYSFDALEPFIDKLTMEIHYGKHHKAYYDNFITAIKDTEMETMEIKDIFKNISKYPMDKLPKVFSKHILVVPTNTFIYAVLHQ